MGIISGSASEAKSIGTRNLAQTATFQNNATQTVYAKKAADAGFVGTTPGNIFASNKQLGGYGAVDKKMESANQINGIYAKVADPEQDTQDKLIDKSIKQGYSTLA